MNNGKKEGVHEERRTRKNKNVGESIVGIRDLIFLTGGAQPLGARARDALKYRNLGLG